MKEGELTLDYVKKIVKKQKISKEQLREPADMRQCRNS